MASTGMHMEPLWLTVRGRSMEPALAEGDEVLLSPLVGSPVEGEIVVARGRNGGLVLHRVVHASGGRIITRGDACRRDDPPVPPRHVLLRALEVRRRGRSGPIPPAPGALRRLRSRLAPRLASPLAALGRWWRVRPSSSTFTGGGSWA
jgi:signal peptidase I